MDKYLNQLGNIVGGVIFLLLVPAIAHGQFAVAEVENNYSCDDATALKFDQPRYELLDPTEQQIVEGTYYKCKHPEKKVIFLTNPAPTEDDPKVFYGTIGEDDLANAKKNCQGGAAYGGITVSLLGAAVGNPAMADSGNAVFKYGDVACSTLADAFSDDNLSAVLAPQYLVNEAVTKQALSDVVRNIPIVSDTDKANIIKTIQETQVVPAVKVNDGRVEVKVLGKEVKIEPIPEKMDTPLPIPPLNELKFAPPSKWFN